MSFRSVRIVLTEGSVLFLGVLIGLAVTGFCWMFLVPIAFLFTIATVLMVGEFKYVQRIEEKRYSTIDRRLDSGVENIQQLSTTLDRQIQKHKTRTDEQIRQLKKRIGRIEDFLEDSGFEKEQVAHLAASVDLGGLTANLRLRATSPEYPLWKRWHYKCKRLFLKLSGWVD